MFPQVIVLYAEGCNVLLNHRLEHEDRALTGKSCCDCEV